MWQRSENRICTPIASGHAYYAIALQSEKKWLTQSRLKLACRFCCTYECVKTEQLNHSIDKHITMPSSGCRKNRLIKHAAVMESISVQGSSEHCALSTPKLWHLHEFVMISTTYLNPLSIWVMTFRKWPSPFTHNVCNDCAHCSLAGEQISGFDYHARLKVVSDWKAVSS